MSAGGQLKVYILGAGCSIACGYPDAPRFLDCLKQFQNGLTERTPCLNEHVVTAIRFLEEMRPRGCYTVDDAVALLEDTPFQTRGIGDHRRLDEEKERYGKIRSAKIATGALFLSKELDLESDLSSECWEGYVELLKTVFPQDGPLDYKLRQSNARVLTFNYDRVFETAFCLRFEGSLGENGLLYSEMMLNSGLTLPEAEEIKPAPGRFCFLKLHGSIGFRVDTHYINRAELEKGSRKYGHSLPVKVRQKQPEHIDPLAEFEDAIAKRNHFEESLLFFPHERRRFEHNARTHEHSGPFSRGVWSHARAVISQALEIQIIGCSFREPFTKVPFVDLIHDAPEETRIIIRNPGADEICKNLERHNPALKNRLESDTNPF